MQPRILRALAIVILIAPTLALASTAALWLPTLPATIPVQWSSNGVSATAPTPVLVVGLGAITALASVIGIATVRGARTAEQLLASRRAVTACAAVAGAASAVWISCAALSLGGAPVSSTEVGGWPLLALTAGLAWGALPALLLSAAGGRERATA
ncbi:hypothetical protein OVN20_02880 [Microcella daejeonensis]|uniref:hypothetical protein n=1 Tax=Microcella daejeonensis TaxID=2994971 RepID=UPI00226E29C1|nr:hypothetical protein [Microcella daejeonensis]WAB84528.1 hypothetical protein OVN20_02880 [Microcella daejeonensis]